MHNFQSDNLIPDKSEWGNGIWQTEPDLATWTDDGSGLEVQVLRDADTGALGFMVGVEPGHPAHGLEGAAVPTAAAIVPETHEANGKWWFSVSFNRDHDGQPARRHRVEHYRSLLDVQEHATRLALDLKRFGDAMKRGDVTVPAAAVTVSAPPAPDVTVPEGAAEPEKQLTLDEAIAKQVGGNVPDLAAAPKDPVPELDETAAVEDEPDAEETAGGRYGNHSGKRSRKKS